MTRTRPAVLFAVGLFALVAQTLLFRDFLWVLEGSELGIGAFFGSWLLAVGLGAIVGRAASRRTPRLAGRFDLLALLYIPAFLAQRGLMAGARPLSGVAAYEVFPLVPLVLVSTAVNAPTSLLSGFLFTLACTWAQADAALPVARVYLVETLGGCAGGVLATVLLAVGLPSESIFLLSAGAVLVAVAAHRTAGLRPVSRGLFPCALVVAAVAVGLVLGPVWAEFADRATWSRLLSAGEYRGAFATAQAKYLYGERAGETVVLAGGGTVEAVPGTEHASEVVAVCLSQQPDATRVLLIGPGSLAIALRLLALPRIAQVTWLHPDPAFPARVIEVLPDRWREAAARIETPPADPRAFLSATQDRFDLAILNLPDAATLALGRYSTREFFARVAARLVPGGVVAVRLAGAENYLGEELALLGASAVVTLKAVFEHLALKPGEETWLFASNGGGLSDAPAELRDRFALIPGAPAIYPPDGLLSLYPPDRAQYQLALYNEAAKRLGAGLLQSEDARPAAPVFNLLLALRRAGTASLADRLPTAMHGGVLVGLAAILIYGLLRGVYLRRGAHALSRPSTPGIFDAGAIVFAMGLSGMAASIVLMFLFQARHGALFLYVGLASALFLLGSFAGGAACRRLLVRRADEPHALLPALTLAHMAVLVLCAHAGSGASRVLFASLFAAAGVFGGVYFPIAARRIEIAGFDAATAGARLELVDHVGGALGALAVGLLALPLLGARTALLLLAALVAAVNLTPQLAGRVHGPRAVVFAAESDRFDRAVRPVGYTLLGVALFLLVVAQIGAAVRQGQEATLLESAAQSLAGGAALEPRSARLADGTAFAYWAIAEAPDRPGGYIFGTRALAPGVNGYGGPISAAVRVSPDGILQDFQIVLSNETPAYLSFLGRWFAGLAGRDLFSADPFRAVDAVSGATMTSRAVMQTLATAGQQFAAAVLGKAVERPAVPAIHRTPDRGFVVLAILTAAALTFRFRPRPWPRRAFLMLSVVVLGFWLNLQYSSHHVFALLGFRFPGWSLTGALFLLAGVPLVVFLFGNVFCGYICPFGALQELVGELRPRALTTDPPKDIWRYGRAMKYALLFLFAVLFALSGSFEVLAPDPLITFFGALRGRAVFALGAALLLASFAYRRFFCRNLCPAGAFLALVGGAPLLGRLLPQTRPARCDLGVRDARDLDCIRCDRCRHESR